MFVLFVLVYCLIVCVRCVVLNAGVRINLQDKTIKKMAPGVTAEAYLKTEERGTVAAFWKCA